MTAASQLARQHTPLGKSLLLEVADFVASQLQLRVHSTADAFVSLDRDPEGPGVRGVCGKLGDSVIDLRLELLRCPTETSIHLGTLGWQFPSLGDRCRPVEPPRPNAAGQTSLWVGLEVGAKPLDFARKTALGAMLQELQKVATELQASLPQTRRSSDLFKLYGQMRAILQPIDPQSTLSGIQLDVAQQQWADQTCDFLDGNCSVAICLESELMQQLALAIVAKHYLKRGGTLGRLLLPSISVSGLMKLAAEAPGTVVVPARALQVATSRYELSSESQTLLTGLAAAGHPMVFVGSCDDLQQTFTGQGTRSDALRPVVRRLGDADLRLLVVYALRMAACSRGGLMPAEEKRLMRELLESVDGIDLPTAQRWLPSLAAKAVHQLAGGANVGTTSTAQYVTVLRTATETFSGLQSKPRASRSKAVEARYLRVLTDPGLLAELKQHLVGQDQPLGQLVQRLQTETLTRPPHQPLRYAAQGTPATGKSESARWLASRLSIPFVNVDAASMPDWYSASAQLLGSGRGIVGSHEAGRLERAAKSSDGVFIEVSDIDHAAPSVQSGLADLFLQVLETGEIQTATGASIDASNLIISFTLNLPDGHDEKVRKGFGFGGDPSERQVAGRVQREVKNMLSGAFLSRVGTPILFGALSDLALAEIARRAVTEAVVSAVARSQIELCDVQIDSDLGENMVTASEANCVSFGARALLDECRSRAAQAVLRWMASGPLPKRPVTLRLSSPRDGELTVTSI